MRRRFAALLVLAALAAACGSDGTEATADTTTTEASGAFPVTVEHIYGETVVPEQPTRVVSVGLTEQDTLLALGVKPVGVTEWYGEHPHATWPWAQEALGDATPEVLTTSDGFQFERIAALDPDLILGLNAGMTEVDYEKLSAIAPTVAHGVGQEGYFSPWDLQTRTIGAALGRADEADALVADIEEQFADAAAEHPEFAGTPAVFLQNAIYEGKAIAYQEGLSTKFLTDLGFTIPSELDPFVQEAEGSQAYIPLEQLSVLDVARVLIWGTEEQGDIDKLAEEPLYRRLQAVEEGRLVFTDGLTAGAIYFTSPLSLPFVLEKLVPALSAALGGEGPARAVG